MFLSAVRFDSIYPESCRRCCVSHPRHWVSVRLVTDLPVTCPLMILILPRTLGPRFPYFLLLSTSSIIGLHATLFAFVSVFAFHSAARGV